MKQFYLALSLMGAMSLQAAPPIMKPYAGKATESDNGRVTLDYATWHAPMRVSVDELFACPENTVLDGPFIADEVGYQGFQSSDQARPEMPTKFYQAFHGCYNSVNAVRVIGLFNYFDDEEYNWYGCDSRGGVQEDYTMTEPITFEVSFYRQTANGMPGECVYQKNIDIIGRYMGLTYGSGAEEMPLYEFSTELGEDIHLESGFISFSAADIGEIPTCWFSLFTADTSMDYGYIMLGDYGMNYANLPSIFSLMGDGSPVAQKALRVDRLSAPSSNATGTHEKVTVKLINVGATEIDNATLELVVDGKVIATETVPTVIASKGACNYTFLQRVDLSSEGDHTVEVRNVTPGDENVSLPIASISTYTCSEGEACDSSAQYPDDEIKISHVVIGNIDNESDADSYSDYTNTHTTTIHPGEKLLLEVEPMETAIIGVWVDWNNDGTFSGPGEEIGYIYDQPLEVAIPEGVSLEEGMKRMRLVMDYYGEPEPCGNYYFGETEDYGLIVTRNADTPSLGVSLAEVAEDMKKGDIKEVALELFNTGDAQLNTTFSINYSLPTVYEPRKLAPVEKFGTKPVAAKTAAKASEPATDADVKKVLRYDGGFASSVALDNYSSAIFAHYYPADVMGALEGMTLSSIDVYINEVPAKAAIKVYGQGESGKAGVLVAEQPFEAVADSWNHVVLDNPVTISGEDLWFGVQFDEMESRGYYIGVDGIPAVAGYGDLCNIGGETWWSMMELGIDHNFCIRGNVTGNSTAALNWLTLDKDQMSLAAGENDIMNAVISTEEIPAGTYEAAIEIRSNDELKPVYSVPVYLSNGIVTGIDNTSLDRTQVRVEGMNVVVSSEHNILSVDAYDMTGCKVAADNNAGRRHEVSLELLTKGTYVLNVTYTDGTREAFKIAVIR
ncbi:MAG: hypothetical protein HDR88_08145 [Bacteroides sp.]|nr:hypothetical protein [Bacteroides sp.]